MSRAIIVKRISRRTGVVGIPRATSQSGTERLKPGENVGAAARRVLALVKRKVARDGNDRQIELATVETLSNGRHEISSRVLYRVYRSHSDKKVHVYAGAAHQGKREG